MSDEVTVRVIPKNSPVMHAWEKWRETNGYEFACELAPSLEDLEDCLFCAFAAGFEASDGRYAACANAKAPGKK